MGSDDDDDRTKHRPSPHISHKVTLAAVSSLFAVTLFIILLFLYAKYRQNRRRQRRRIDFVSRLVTAQTATAGDNPDHTARKTALGGLDSEVVNSLPEFIYKRAPVSPSEAAIECSVCLGALADGAKVRLLPNCGHTFHLECVDVWLTSHTTCPLCRAEVEPRPAEPTEAILADSATLPQPTAPPVDEISLLRGDAAAPPQQAESKPSGSGSSGSRLGSFRRMLSRDRSSMRSLDGCGDQVSSVGVSHHHDLERQ